jgi:hypothetical protein
MVTAAGPSGVSNPAASLAVSPAACKGDAAADDAPLKALPTPAHPTAEFSHQLQQGLQRASWKGAAATKVVLTASVCTYLITKVDEIVEKEPALLELAPAGQQVTVVGDTHGHYPDVCQL